MPDFRQYGYRTGTGTWEPTEIDITRAIPSGSDQKLVVNNSASAGFATLSSAVSYVWWTAQGGGFYVRFGETPTTGCGMYFEPSSTGIWNYSMAACARFIAEGATAASIFATLLI